MNRLHGQGLAKLKFFTTRLVYLLLFSCISLTAVTYADDTEIFRTTPVYESGKANVLIMLDSSSSMNQAIKYVDGYDPDAPLPDGEVGKCPEDVIFVETKSTPGTPACNNSGASNTPHINPSALKCRDIAEFMLEVGSISARVSQLTFPKTGPNKNKAVWAIFNKNNAVDKPVECLDDEGIHGDVSILTVEDGKVVLDEEAYATETTTENYILDGSDTGWSETEEPYVDNGDGVLVNPHWSADNFVTFYTGHFLNYVAYVIANDPDNYIQTDGTTLAKTAMTEIVENFRGFNLGIARYDIKGNQKTAFILAPTVSLDDEDMRGDLQRFYIDPLGIKAGDPIPPNNDISPENNTFTGGQPMSAGQYEAYTYFKGLHAFGGGPPADTDGKYSSPQPPATTAATGTVTPTVNNVPSAIDASGNYISPITDDSVCTGNYVLYLTAGGASSDAATDPEINAAELFKSDGTGSGTLSAWNGGDCGISNDYCLDELSKFMYEHDFDPDIANGNDGKGGVVLQNVTTYGISINNSAPDLDEAATVGGGYFRKAENPGAISAILQDIISEIIGKNTTFISPSISVNNFNRLQHLNDLYFSLFTPSEKAVWDGNLKKYKIINGVIKDATDPVAVDAIEPTGSFSINTRSYWTNPADPDLSIASASHTTNKDGNETRLGGFASRILDPTAPTAMPDARKVYTYTGTSKVLSNTTNKLHHDTAEITTSMLGIAASDPDKDAKRIRLLEWGRGIKYEVDAMGVETGVKSFNRFIGDLLHTTPVVIEYDLADYPNDAIQSIYFGTNNGFIHAVDNKAQNDLTGSLERFAFAPQEILPKFNEFLSNTGPEKSYGMDGPVTFWLDESASTIKNAKVNANEKVYVYAAQRRGGRNIYALEVHDRDNPELAWTIKGGVTPGFEKLGQTWSTMQKSTILTGTGTTKKDVVVFAGGYDNSILGNQDAASNLADAQASTATATMGNAIYIADATTGELLWYTSPAPDATTSAEHLPMSDMTYAIPSNVRVADTNGDGNADIMIVGDLGGQIWRFDIAKDTSTNGFNITGGVIAKLNQSSDTDIPADEAAAVARRLTDRRFFSPPSLSLISNNSSTFLTISIGSGYRAHPLDETIQDKFYVLRDYNPFIPPRNAAGDIDYDSAMIYDDSDLGDPLDGEPARQLLNVADNADLKGGAGTHGWVFKFTNSGEKVLNTALSADGKVFFTTYLPETGADLGISCAPNAHLGKSRLYTAFLLTGGAAGRSTDPSDPDPDPEYYKDTSVPGISANPTLHYGEIIPDLGGGGGDPDDEDCASLSQLMILVGTEVFDPGICTAAQRSYWKRVY